MKSLYSSRVLRFIAIALLFPGAAAPVTAQTLSDLVPEPIPHQAGPIGEEPASLDTPLIDSGAQPGEEIILEKLKGLIFVDRPEAITVDAGVRLMGRPADVSRFPHLENPDFDYLVRTFVGRPVSQDSLRRLTLAVKLYLKHLGSPFSLVFLPEQDITDGYIHVVIIETRLSDEIQVEGARFFSEDQYRREIHQEPGTAIDNLALQKDVDWINRNPFRQVRVSAGPGDAAGTTKLVLVARERRPWQVFAGASNSGTQTTREERLQAGFNWGNAFGWGHQMSLQVSSDVKVEAFKSISGSYTVDLPWRHTLTVSGAYSKTDGLVAEPFELKGKSWQLSLDYVWPLASRWDRYTHALTGGIDFKSSDNNFDFADIPVSDNLTHVAQGRVRYTGTLTDNLGSTTGSVNLVFSPGGITSYNDDESFGLSRANATAEYFYANFSLRRSTRLQGFFEGWEWLVNGRLQLSSENLLGSEQIGAGGLNSVRGYEEGEVFGDQGILLSQELHLPIMDPPLDFFAAKVPDQLRLYLFEDYARTWSVNAAAGENPVNLHSAGIGLRYQFGSYLSVHLAHGWQFRDSGSSDTGDNRRLHFTVRLSY